MMHIRKNGERDLGHHVDYAFSGDIDADEIIQLTLNGVEIAMPMREWHELALRSVQSEEPKHG